MSLATGGGRYEKETTDILRKVGADFTLVLVVHKDPEQCGFSCAFDQRKVRLLPIVITSLRAAAQQFEDYLLEELTKQEGEPPTPPISPAA